MLKAVLKHQKWLRRYRTIFIITLVILSLQILISILLSSKSVAEQENQWEPSNYESSMNVPIAARKINEEPKNKKAKHQNSTQIRLEELQFTLPCQISGKEAVSAINRAKTQHCKQAIANITCMALKNELYPLELKGSCPASGYVFGKELGCFKDEKNFRLLSGYFGVNKVDNSPKYCIQLCLQSGFPLAGVQYSDECFCGIDDPPLSSKVPDSSCNMKCPGDQHSMCGGYFTMNVYQTGIKRFSAHIANESTENIKPVKIVFLLTLNGRALRQVKRLIKILYHVDHYYYIHVDIRQDYLFRELLPLEKLPHIRLTRNRFATIWGGASLLTMLRSCMTELLRTDWTWDFVLNLSESDFPVKTVKDLTNFLSANKGKNFVKSHGREVQRFMQKQGLDKTFIECETRMWRVGDRKLPYGIQVDGGSDWVALSKKFVEYVANKNTDDLIDGLLKIFKHTLLPAESFFHTALRNSKFCNTYVDNNLHVTNWKRKLGCKCQYKHVVDWCGCSPNDFTLEDWPRILNTQSRQLFFARKFEPIINQAVILKLELWLSNLEKPTKDVVNLNSYWQSVYHHSDLGVKTDDSLMTFADSIRRRTVKYLSNDTECGDSVKDLIEVVSYHHRDNYRYTLFRYEDVEVAVKHLNKISITKSSPLMENIQKLSVNTEYDQKEQISRNFLRIISPYSELMLIYKFDSKKLSKVYNLTSLWVDPVGNLQDVAEFSVDEITATGHIKSNVRAPHLAGVWTVKILYKNSQLAQISFLIVPQQYNVANPQIHSQNKYFGDAYSKFLPSISQKEVLERKAIDNGKKQGREFKNWLDNLTSNFYSIENLCSSANSGQKLCGKSLNRCLDSNWSSLSPDPKSAINNFNSSTGMFDIW